MDEIHGNYLNGCFKIADRMREERNKLRDLACIPRKCTQKEKEERIKEKIRVQEMEKEKRSYKNGNSWPQPSPLYNRLINLLPVPAQT
jgi:hypothetical protein